MKTKPIKQKSPSDKFREELNKLLPGYKWTISNSTDDTLMIATGIISSGFNRISTMEIVRRDKGRAWYESKIAGFGKRALWIGEGYGASLAKSVRQLQEYCERQAAEFGFLASKINSSRKKKEAE